MQHTHLNQTGSCPSLTAAKKFHTTYETFSIFPLPCEKCRSDVDLILNPICPASTPYTFHRAQTGKRKVSCVASCRRVWLCLCRCVFPRWPKGKKVHVPSRISTRESGRFPHHIAPHSSTSLLEQHSSSICEPSQHKNRFHLSDNLEKRKEKDPGLLRLCLRCFFVFGNWFQTTTEQRSGFPITSAPKNCGQIEQTR